MKHLSPVVWSEGMHLGPHQFQAQNRYFEDLVEFASTSLAFEPNGVIGLQVDADALANGTFSLVHARGIFPDGMTFYMPEADPAPEARSVVDVFPPVRNQLKVYLAVSPRKSRGLNCLLNGEGDPSQARYTAVARALPDEGTGHDEKDVRLGRKNIRIVFDVESLDGLTTLPIAAVKRDGAGRFVLDEDYIPPCLQVSAGVGLMKKMRGLIDLLDRKADGLSVSRRPQAGTTSGFSAQEVANAWLLHSVNSAAASLRHLCFTKHAHPEELFVELSRLGGVLCTFSLDSHPRRLPLYDHQDLASCFDVLLRHIREHLDIVVPTNCIPIPIRRADDYLFAAKAVDQRVFGKSQWILAISSGAGEVETAARTPRLVKMCSWDFVQKLVQKALPGLALTHIPSPPAAVSPKLEWQYFSVDKSGACWDQITKTGRIGVYIPGDLPQAEVELMALVES